jgi:hypothetical protein
MRMLAALLLIVFAGREDAHAHLNVRNVPLASTIRRAARLLIEEKHRGSGLPATINGSRPNVHQRQTGRDGHLQALAKLLNRHSQMFLNWTDNEANYEHFLSTLLPWILSTPSFPMHHLVPSSQSASYTLANKTLPLPPLPEPSCSNPSYSQIRRHRRILLLALTEL